jgi:hypothetical protein
MKPVMRALAVAASLVAFAALAKPWNGIEPGVTKKAAVIARFGEPTKVQTTADGREVLAYYKERVISGTTQAQFKVDAKTSVVERIDVFPGPVIDREAIEGTYGAICPQNTPNADAVNPCHVKKVTDDFRVYFLYVKLGLAIFFKEDQKTVHSFIFQPAK